VSIAVCACILGPAASFASGTDTLSQAKLLIQKRKFKKATKLLVPYATAHPKDVYTTWLAAQSAHWAGRYKLSIKLYNGIFPSLPGNYALIMDYARTLMDYSELDKVTKILKPYQTGDPKYAEAHILQSRIDYWQGDYKKAKADIPKVSGSNKEIDALQTDIANARSPWLNISTAYMRDNQPMQVISPEISAGVWLNPFANIYAGFRSPVYIAGATSTSQSFYAGDKLHFQKAGIDLSIDAGVAKLPFHNTATWTGNIDVKKTLVKHLVFGLSLSHSPYLYTVSSLDTAVTAYRYGLSSEWADQTTVNGKAAIQFDQIPLTGNYNTTVYAYAFAPTLKASVFEFRLGYGYSFSTSRYNSYSPQNSLSYITTHYTDASAYTGIYDPSFTPSHQQVHSALVNITVHPLRIMDIGAGTNIGFYAMAANPYLYLYPVGSGDVAIGRGYSNVTYLPIQANAWIGIKLTRKASLKAEYAYHRTYFFDSHYVGLSCKVNFWK
jgi:tetratricopeptide (TPR) repeat protein